MEPVLMGSHSQCKKHIKIKHDPESAFPKTWTIMTCQTSSDTLDTIHSDLTSRKSLLHKGLVSLLQYKLLAL